jgi:hypothetical protein
MPVAPVTSTRPAAGSIPAMLSPSLRNARSARQQRYDEFQNAQNDDADSGPGAPV